MNSLQAPATIRSIPSAANATMYAGHVHRQIHKVYFSRRNNEIDIEIRMRRIRRAALDDLLRHV